MDELIRRFNGVVDKDLVLCLDRGVAYQRDMSRLVAYDQSYFDKCKSYEGKKIGNVIHAGRVEFVRKYVSDEKPVLDIGIGSGEFIRWRRHTTFGYDINPQAIVWLKAKKKWADLDEFGSYSAFTMWDVLEHIPTPNDYFKFMGKGSYLFLSLPLFDDLNKIRSSKHYRPGEHLYYWTLQGIVDYTALYGFRVLEMSAFEIDAGRESIYSLALIRDLPDYEDTLEQYKKLHRSAYGASGFLFFGYIATTVVQLNPRRILDYGCGRSNLAAHFWKDGKREILYYDPAIPDFGTLPEGQFDLVLCTDVMEHILMRDVDRVFNEIKSKSNNVIFTISLKPAKARLPDGRNAHVTLLSADEWMRWIGDCFGYVERMATDWDHILLARTFKL